MSLSDKSPMLEGVRVIDLTTVVFGPYATQILGDLGADIIKIESPAGDTFRYTAKAARTRGMSPGHMALNRGKRSVMLDLKTAADLALLRDLLKTADVFIHNVRLKAVQRLGLDADTVRALNPGIVYVHCTGFGSGGPYEGLPAYDDVIQAATGTATLLSRVDGDKRPRYLPSLIADKVAGLHGAYAVLAALVHKLRTGEGQVVEVPMFESFAHFMLSEHLGGLTFDPPIGPVCYPRQIDHRRQPFPTFDGYISLVAYSDGAWQIVFSVLGAPEVLEQPRFSTPAKRRENVTELYGQIALLTPARSTADWVARLRAASIPVMPVRDVADMLDDPHLQQSGFFRRFEHPSEGHYYDLKSPVRFGARATPAASPAQRLGEDTDLIRMEVHGNDQ